MLPLEGLRVLDFSRLLPGPYCTLLLADLGADVVKMEDPRGGDYLRAIPPMADGADGAGEADAAAAGSAGFRALNRNKRSLAIDLKHPAARAVVLDLVARSFDTVVESFRPGVLDSLGLGWAALSKANPKLVLCSISGYPAHGPLRSRAGHDLTYVALAGVLGFGAAPEGGAPLAPPAVQIADLGGAFAAALAVLAADRERARTGCGRHVELSLASSALAFLHLPLGSRLIAGPERAGLSRDHAPLSGAMPCYRLYRTRDGRSLAVAALEPKFWGRFCEAVGLAELADQGWLTGEEGERVAGRVGEVVAARSLAEWEDFLRNRDLCCEPVREGEEIVKETELMDPEAIFNIVNATDGRTERHLRGPLRMGAVPQRFAPRLGEHTDAVLAEAGYGAAQIAALRRDGVVVG